MLCVLSRSFRFLSGRVIADFRGLPGPLFGGRVLSVSADGGGSVVLTFIKFEFLCLLSCSCVGGLAPFFAVGGGVEYVGVGGM